MKQINIKQIEQQVNKEIQNNKDYIYKMKVYNLTERFGKVGYTNTATFVEEQLTADYIKLLSNTINKYIEQGYNIKHNNVITKQYS